MIEARISMLRIQEFLLEEEIDLKYIEKVESSESMDALSMDNGYFLMSGKYSGANIRYAVFIKGTVQ